MVTVSYWDFYDPSANHRSLCQKMPLLSVNNMAETLPLILLGEITSSELGSVMRQLGLKPSDTELDDLMNEIDTDRSGTISFEGTVNLSSYCLYCSRALLPNALPLCSVLFLL